MFCCMILVSLNYKQVAKQSPTVQWSSNAQLGTLSVDEGSYNCFAQIRCVPKAAMCYTQRVVPASVQHVTRPFGPFIRRKPAPRREI